MAQSTIAVAVSSAQVLAHFPAKTFQPAISLCCYVPPETSWGACDGVECSAAAVIHDLASEQDYCAKHWREVGRG
jgi:hypothetical protein